MCCNTLIGKKLLVMDNSALGACAVKRAKELGIKTIVANFYPIEKSASKQIADETVDVDISNIDAMVALVKEKQIDGIFVGWTDSHLPFYAEICRRTGLPCCGTKEQFEVLSNDKQEFKKKCLEYGVPTIPDFHIDMRFDAEDMKKIEYPVIVKPADGSGGRGVKKCNNEIELIDYYSKLYNESKSKKIICEKYIDSPHEIFLNYTIQNGFCSLSASFMSHRAKSESQTGASAILHVYSSSYIDKYKKEIEPAVIRMFQGIGLKNAVLSLQGFIYNEKFYFHETGLRMGGGQSYLFTQKLNGISALDLMIEFSLTGEMKRGDVKKQDNCKFEKYACNYYISLRPGVITSIKGVDVVSNMEQVLQLTSFHKVGDTIGETDSLDRVIYRLHVMDDTKEALANTLESISTTMQILDQNGMDMQIEKLTYERVMEMIQNS